LIDITAFASVSESELRCTEKSAPPLYVVHLSSSWCHAVRPTESLMKVVSSLNRSDTRRSVPRLIGSGAPLTGAGRLARLGEAKFHFWRRGPVVRVFRRCASSTVPNGAATLRERLGCVLGHPRVHRSVQRNGQLHRYAPLIRVTAARRQFSRPQLGAAASILQKRRSTCNVQRAYLHVDSVDFKHRAGCRMRFDLLISQFSVTHRRRH